MKPEWQVCSFEQADQLYKLGVVQHSLYYYTFYTPKPDAIYLNPKKHAVSLHTHALKKYGADAFVEIRSAFNVSELALLLNLKEGVFDAILLAGQLIAKLQSGEIMPDEANGRILAAV